MSNSFPYPPNRHSLALFEYHLNTNHKSPQVKYSSTTMMFLEDVLLLSSSLLKSKCQPNPKFTFSHFGTERIKIMHNS